MAVVNRRRIIKESFTLNNEKNSNDSGIAA